MSARARDDVICTFCSQKVTLKNLPVHHERNHPGEPKPNYKTIEDPKQQKLCFAPAPKRSRLETDIPVAGDQSCENTGESSNQSVDINIIDQIQEASTCAPPTLTDQLLILINHAPNINHLVDYIKNEYEYKDGVFTCLVCKSEYSLHSNDKKKFQNIRITLSRHLISPIHMKKLKLAEIEENNRKKDLAEAKNHALNCARAAYLVYKDNMSLDSYPKLIQLIFRCGGTVGHQHHSRRFPAIFLPVLSRSIRQTITEGCKGKPIGIMADKMTTQGRTRHIFGFRVSQLYDTSSDLCAVDIYASHSVVKDLAADGLAQHMIKMLDMFGFDKSYIRQNIVGMAFDGQYILMNVNRELCKHLNIIRDVPINWDPMHELNLAYDDAETKFVDSTCQLVNAIMKEFKWGKSLEVLLDFKDLCDVFYKPKFFKTMKFVAYAGDVFKAFACDFRAIAAYLEKNDNALLGKIMDPVFIFNFIFIRDIVTVIAKLSKSFQKSNQLPFNYHRTYNVFICEMDQRILQVQSYEKLITKLASRLDKMDLKKFDTFEKFVKDFPDYRFLSKNSYPKAELFSNSDEVLLQLVVFASGILNHATFLKDFEKLVIEKVFTNCPLLSTLSRTSRFMFPWKSNSMMLTSMSKSLKNVVKHLEKLREHVIERFDGTFKIHELYDRLLSFRYLMFPSENLQTESVVMDSNTFIKMLENFHYFPHDEESRLKLYTQYQVFHDKAVELMTELRVNATVINEIHFTKEMYKHMADHPEFQWFLDALVTMPTSEAICETWGSEIEHVGGRRPAAFDGNSEKNQYGTVEERINVMLNGPPAGYHGNDKLLRFSLESLFGVNYKSQFLVKTSTFNTMSKVLDMIYQGTHEAGSARQTARRRILPYFRI